MRVKSTYIQDISATNTLKKITGRVLKPGQKNIIARVAACTHIQVSSQKMLTDSYANLLDETAIKVLITKYWTQTYDGQTPTSTTVDNMYKAFNNYVVTATEVVGRFLCFKRTMDQWNLESDDLGKIGPLFTKPDDMNTGELKQIYDAYSRYYDIFSTKTNAKLDIIDTVWGDLSDPANRVSSSKWSQQFTAPLKKVLLPIDVLVMLNFIFASTFELSSDDDETLRYVQFWQTAEGAEFPDYGATGFEGSTTKFLAGYSAALTALEATLSAYPMLQRIMEDMGYKPALEYVNTYRDLAGQSLRVIRDNDDTVEYAIKSVLLAQTDTQTYADTIENSNVLEAKEKYLPEIILESKYNVTATNVYNFQNFLRGKVESLCVNILVAQSTVGNPTSSLYEIQCHCGDNITLYAADNAAQACAMSTTIDTVSETDALVGLTLHLVVILSDNSLNIYESRIEGSARTYVLPSDDIAALIMNVNSAFYLDVPVALERLMSETLFSVDYGVATIVTYADKARSESNHNMSDKKKKNKKKNKDKDKKQGSDKKDDSSKSEEKPQEEKKNK